MGFRFSYVLAAGFAAGITWWMATGSIVIGGQTSSENGTPPPAQRSKDDETALFSVQVEELVATPHTGTLEIRGRTEADARVGVLAETTGRVAKRLVREGQRVSVGDVLCELDIGARKARVLEAEAKLAQTKLDFEAASSLNTKGFSAKNSVAAKKAAMNAASAELEVAQIELERTRIASPVDGVVESPMAEVGTILAAGQACATVIDADPMLMIAQVSEQDIAKIKIGQTAHVKAVTGESVSGVIRYISTAAEPSTRTFRIEIEIPNPDLSLRDGVTARALVSLKEEMAHKISPGILSLNDAGTVGVRTVMADDTVRFAPVDIIAGDTQGIWVKGLPEKVRIITVGQDYVVTGQLVKPVVKAAEASSK